jgi:serine/threonine protein kinase
MNHIYLTDFGSAKNLEPGVPSVTYITSRYYRAPELMFGNTEYTFAIDIWSVGCVIAELLLQIPLFPGASGCEQIVEIIKILGTPTKDDISNMNPHYGEFRFPPMGALPWEKIFKPGTDPNAVKFVSSLLKYNPKERPNPLEALASPYFDELRD